MNKCINEIYFFHRDSSSKQALLRSGSGSIPGTFLWLPWQCATWISIGCHWTASGPVSSQAPPVAFWICSVFGLPRQPANDRAKHSRDAQVRPIPSGAGSSNGQPLLPTVLAEALSDPFANPLCPILFPPLFYFPQALPPPKLLVLLTLSQHLLPRKPDQQTVLSHWTMRDSKPFGKFWKLNYLTTCKTGRPETMA